MGTEENTESWMRTGSSGRSEEVIGKWAALLQPLIEDGFLRGAELCIFDRRETIFHTLWSSFRPVGPVDDEIRRAHNTSLLEALVHGEPISTTDMPLTTFRDWEDLGAQTGLEHFITIPALLFSGGDSELVLVAGARQPHWDKLLAYLVAQTKGNNRLPGAGSM